jgi:preprotein translocase subunit SecE
VFLVFKMYRGIERRVELNHDDLEEGVDYACRVCAIRVCGDDGQQLVGPYSNNVNFHIPLPSRGGEDSSPSKSHSVSSKSPVKVSTTFITVRFNISILSYNNNSNFIFNFFQTVREKMSRISYESRVGMMAVLALIIVAFFISLITHHVVS